MSLVCEQCRKGSRPLTLAADGRRLCASCRERQQRVLVRLAASIARGRVLAADMSWVPEGDRRALARRLGHLAKRTPDGTATVLRGIAESLRTSSGLITCDITSIDQATIRTIGSTLETALEHEVVNAGPDKDAFVALVAGWHEWTRHHGGTT